MAGLLAGIMASMFELKNLVDMMVCIIYLYLSSSSQRAAAISNNVSNNIKKTHTGLISVLQGFQKCIA